VQTLETLNERLENNLKEETALRQNVEKKTFQVIKIDN
jgi:hypothetical protein